MKILMIYADNFNYNPSEKTLDNFEDVNEPGKIEKTIVGFIHAEKKDEEEPLKTEKKLVKNLKWAAGKNNTKKIVLHSFAHLSESKASPEFTKQLFDNAETRLKNADYETVQTPFGYFLDLDIKAPGFSQARMFKSF